jgi:uncharacterized protein
VRGIFTAVAFFFALHGAASAQPAADQISPALFIVRDADSTLYLYGTVHALPPNAPWANEAVRAALAEAEEVWTESDMSPERADQFVADLTTSMLIPADAPLSAQLSATHRTTLRYVEKQLDVELDRLAPWQAALMVMSWGGEGGRRFLGAGVDDQLAEAAREQGKRMRWLEDIDVADFAALSQETQLQFLLFVLDGMQREEAGEPLDMTWARGDLVSLEASQIASMAVNYPAFYQWIAVARNNAWIEVLAVELQGSGVDFIAVGVGHLLGAHSLVEQLRARGYTVERVGA